MTFRPRFVNTDLDLRPLSTREHGLEAIYRCEVQGDLIEITDKKYTKGSPEKMIRDIEALIKREMEERADQMVEKLQKQYKSDVLMLGLKLRGHHYHDYWVKHDWV